MLMSLSKLEKYFVVDKLIYHSLEQSLYQISAIIDGQEYFITDQNGTLLRSFKLHEMQKKMVKVESKASVLRHVSAYDEMIGGPEKIACNALEVTLSLNDSPFTIL
tara:strand:+ start:81 stop:398 length:318 start_codon:yes stop_codon:yes gene_type:complete